MPSKEATRKCYNPNFVLELRDRRDKMTEAYSTFNQGSWYCSICHFTSKKKTNVREHIESKHINDGFSYICRFCPKTYKSRNSLRFHVGNYHKGVRLTNDNLF